MTPADRLAAALADRYAIDRELGAGGMATVYLAHDVRHDRKAVLFVRDQRATIWAMPSVLDLELTRLRAMTATEKVASMHALWRQAWSLTSAGIRARQPEWSPEQVEVEVREIFRRGSQ